ncbi:MAG: MBL fold metallo-hydrolase [Prevotella sp.]|nr:MBL fold metallo-hydrolase [Prevotella sp.]
MNETLRYISFGSGSSGNCSLLWTSTDALFIDAGVGIRLLKKYFAEYGVSLPHFCSILVTHDHADHVKCVGALCHDHSLPVYATAAVHHGIDRNYCVGRKVPAAYRRYLSYGQTEEVGAFRVTPFRVPHDSTDNVGFQIMWNNVCFVIITDAGCVTEEMAEHIRQANYLVIEANHDIEMLDNGPYPRILKERIKSDTGHLSNTACAQAVLQNATPKLRHVWLCHLSQENNHPVLAQKTMEATLRNNGIIVGIDFKLDVLRRRGVTGVYYLDPANEAI